MCRLPTCSCYSSIVVRDVQEAERSEELESLQAIFPPDEVVVLEQSPSCVRLRFPIVSGEVKDNRKCLLDVTWCAEYPGVALTVAVGNAEQLSGRAVKAIVTAATAEAEACVGMAATFAVVQAIRDGFDSFVPVTDSLSLWELEQHNAKQRAEGGDGGAAAAAAAAASSSAAAAAVAAKTAAAAAKEPKSEFKSKATKVGSGYIVSLLWCDVSCRVVSCRALLTLADVTSSCVCDRG